MGNAAGVFIGLVSWTGKRPKTLWKYEASKSGKRRTSCYTYLGIVGPTSDFRCEE